MKKIDKTINHTYFRIRGLAKIFSTRWQFLQERTTLISMETRLDENHCYTVGLEGDQVFSQALSYVAYATGNNYFNRLINILKNISREKK